MQGGYGTLMGMKKETVVISVGGSLIAPPKGLDVVFLKKLKTLVDAGVKAGFRFIIITGGGATARNYQEAGRRVGKLAAEDLDWLGIHSTRLNGHLLLSLFRKDAYGALVKNPKAKVITDKPIIIAAGSRPGWSTDYVAVALAQNIGAKKIVNLSNINYVYTRDPNKFKDAKIIKEISWAEFRKLIPKKWDPGLSSPFDPVAAKLANESNMEAVILNGKNLSELQKYLEGKKFRGTKIV